MSATSNVPLIINGREVHRDEGAFDVNNPSTAKPAYKCTNATAQDALDAVQAGAAAFDAWSQMTPGARREIFLKAARVLDERTKELSEIMASETGGDEGWVGFNVYLGRECLLGCAGRISTIEGRIPSLMDPAVGGLVVKEPYGVVFAMAPWNAPYALGFRAVAWALAAGNTVVFKGSELSPKCLWAVCSVFQEAGLPDGVLNFIASSPANAPDVTKAIIEHPAIKKINFTGSTNVGRIVARMAGENLKPILLELGGKAPAIVCHDADLDVAAKHCILGSFMYSGQVCMSTERILVHESIRADFEKKLQDWVERIVPSQADAPILIQAGAVAKNKALITDATVKGARVLHGDVDAAETTNTRLRPIIVSDVKPDMDIYKQESFGPTVSLISFKEEEDALAIANDTEYGLSSAVFSTDLRRALRLAKKIETGAVHINSMTVHDQAALPHGGAKASGFGRFNGAIEEWVRTKNITFDV